MSQAILNMGIVFGLVQIANKFELDKPENTLYLRLSYSAVQTISLVIIGYIYMKIKAKNDNTKLVYQEAQSPFSQE
jgi:hypothetical protein